MTSCVKRLACQNSPGKRARFPMLQYPCQRQVRPRRRLRSQNQASHHQRPTISLQLQNKMTKIHTLAACACHNSRPPLNRLHHPSPSHAASLHRLRYLTMFLRHHLLRPRLLLARLAPHQQPALQFTTMPQYQHLQYATPTLQFLRLQYAMSSYRLNPKKRPVTPNVQQSVRRSAKPKL